MADSSRSRKRAPAHCRWRETRTMYARLMSQGISNAEAPDNQCQPANWHAVAPRLNGHGRTVKNAQRRESPYAPIPLKTPTTISSRYLSEGERIIIADARQAGKSLRQIAAGLESSPCTVSREVARNRSPSNGTAVDLVDT